jgi:hypothetical protein
MSISAAIPTPAAGSIGMTWPEPRAAGSAARLDAHDVAALPDAAPVEALARARHVKGGTRHA